MWNISEFLWHSRWYIVTTKLQTVTQILRSTQHVRTSICTFTIGYFSIFTFSSYNCMRTSGYRLWSKRLARPSSNNRC